MISQHKNSGPVQRAQRRITNFAALAQRIDGTCAYARVVNLSYKGCELRSELWLDPGEQFILTLPKRGRLGAQVRWVLGDRLGVKFT